ncbi:MAG: radical SAM protein [candidate division KSB1 bacterium]|nr:radical SAM protein [candidate division KSB1 bacterium]
MSKRTKKNYPDDARSCCDPGVALEQNTKQLGRAFLPNDGAASREEQFAQISRMLFQRGLVSGVDGALAWRISDQEILASPMQLPLGLLSANDLARLSLDGKYQNDVVPGLAVEFLVELFRQNPDIGAVIQAHPKFGSVLGLAQDSLPLSLLPDLQRRIGQIKTIGFQIHYTEEVLQQLQARNRARGVFLIENYGVLVFAEDLLTAAMTLDSLEHYLEIIYYSQNSDRKSRPSSSFEVQPVEPHLTKIYLEVTTRCNFNCTTCLRKTGAVPRDQDMTLAKVSELIHQLQQSRTCREIVLLGYGETLCHPQAIDIIEQLKSAGFHLTLVTNGQLLSAEIAERLIAAQLDWLYVSIDGGDYMAHQKIRTGSNFQAIIENLKNLAQQKKDSNRSHPQIGLETVITRDNIRQMRSILNLAEQVGARQILMSNLLPYNSAMVEQSLLNQPGGFIFRNKYHSSTVKIAQMDFRQPTRCRFIAEGAAFVSVEGDVSPCLMASRSHTAVILGAEKKVQRFSLGNVFQEDMAHIWNSDRYRSLRDKFRYYDFPDCFTCRGAEMCLNRINGDHDCFLSETPCSDCLWAKEVVVCP